jgi:hypothetical protein
MATLGRFPPSMLPSNLPTMSPHQEHRKIDSQCNIQPTYRSIHPLESAQPQLRLSGKYEYAG